jgi:hypothetical protein
VGLFFLRFAPGWKKKTPYRADKWNLTGNNNSNRDGLAAVHAAPDSKNRKTATAQQLIRENVKYLIEQLEARHGKRRKKENTGSTTEEEACFAALTRRERVRSLEKRGFMHLGVINDFHLAQKLRLADNPDHFFVLGVFSLIFLVS